MKNEVDERLSLFKKNRAHGRVRANGSRQLPDFFKENLLVVDPNVTSEHGVDDDCLKGTLKVREKVNSMLPVEKQGCSVYVLKPTRAISLVNRVEHVWF